MSELKFQTGPTIPAWGLVAFRVIAAVTVGLLWHAPWWMIVVTALLAATSTGAWAPLWAIAFAAIVGWLPDRVADGSASLSWQWWLTAAAIIFLTHLILISAWVSERTQLNWRVEMAVLGQQLRHGIAIQLIAQILLAAPFLLAASGLMQYTALRFAAVGAVAIIAVVLVLWKPSRAVKD